ncbi:MAG: PilN domain-containing protein [Phycisphaerales bacterium]|nr:PilN domain-containing protein [Phycisphaerales bacterium]
MLIRSRSKHAAEASFLPEDYLERRAERRTNVFSVSLFVVVTLGVVGAFFVTNRQWNDVKRYQQAVNVRYTQAAKDIEQLKVLEKQKNELLEKAEITTALIERVPRSVLLAELINRMPTTMTLMELTLDSKRLDKPIRVQSRREERSADAARGGSGGGSLAAGKGGKKKKEDERPPVTAPRFDSRVILEGVAPNHTDVARYVAGLQGCALLENVELIFSREAVVNETPINRFRIEADLRDEADARRSQPLEAPRQGSLAVAPGSVGAKAEPAAPAGRKNPAEASAAPKEDR